jgi:hypothetical protein
MVKWARGKAAGDTAFAAEVTDITAMINSDSPMTQKLAAKEFMAMFNADAGNSTLATTTTTVDVAGKVTAAATPTANPLSARQFAEETQNAIRNLRGAPLAAKQSQLSKDRQAGRTAGM